MIKNETNINTLRNKKSNIKVKSNKNNFHISNNNNINNANKKNPNGNTIFLGKPLNNNCQDNKLIEKMRNSLLKEKNISNIIFSSPINKKKKITINEQNYTEIKINNSKIQKDGEISLSNKENSKNRIISIEINNPINNSDKLLKKIKNINK